MEEKNKVNKKNIWCKLTFATYLKIIKYKNF